MESALILIVAGLITLSIVFYISHKYKSRTDSDYSGGGSLNDNKPKKPNNK